MNSSAAEDVKTEGMTQCDLDTLCESMLSLEVPKRDKDKKKGREM